MVPQRPVSTVDNHKAKPSADVPKPELTATIK